ncbi:MAG: stalk domain-containing protein [Caldisericia bacterium]|nr:stalk domain-containing protein [Caldisericia bacterium]
MKRKILTGLVIFSTLLLPSGMSVGHAEDPLLFTTHCYQEPVKPNQRTKSIGCVSDIQNHVYVAGIHHGSSPISSFMNVYSPEGALLFAVESDKKVTIQYKDSPDYKEIITLDTPSYIIRAGRSFLTLRFILETFGYKVKWEPVEQKILISWDL